MDAKNSPKMLKKQTSIWRHRISDVLTKDRKQDVVVLSLLSLLVYISTRLVEHQDWGMRMILQIQAHRSFTLDLVNKIFSLFGFEVFWILVPTFVYYGKDRQQVVGINLFFLLNFAFLMLSVVKCYFVEPRPLWLDNSCQSKEDASLRPTVSQRYPPNCQSTRGSLLFFCD